MRKIRHDGESLNGNKFAQELRAQPRKSAFSKKKYLHGRENFFEENEVERHHSHRSEPAKNTVRVQLRRIQRLFD